MTHADELRREAEKLIKLADRIEEATKPLPLEPEVGKVVKFEKYMVGRRYSYAAIQGVKGRWHTTGSSCPPMGYTWKELIAFVGDGVPIWPMKHDGSASLVPYTM